MHKALTKHNLLFFFLAAAILSCGAVWLLGHGYVNDLALSRWAKVLGVLGAPETRLEDFGLLYPHAPVYVLMPFHFIPGLNSAAAPYFASCLAGALLLAVWNYHLAEKRYRPRDRLLLVSLVAAHPYFLWAATSGTHNALSLLMFYLMYLACARLIREGDVRSFIMLGVVLAGYFFVDERTFFIFLALLPLLPLISPPKMLQAAPVSVYLVIGIPLAIAVSAWAYLNWIFHGDAWQFIRSSESSFRGAWPLTPYVEWLRAYGGTFFEPMLATLAVGTVAYPAVGWLVFRARRHVLLLRGTLVLFAHLIIAAGFATSEYFLAHPADMLFLYSAGIMAGVVLFPRETTQGRHELLALLLLSVAGGWLSFGWKPTPDMANWLRAWQGKQVEARFPADLALGEWLRQNRQETLLDDRAAYRAIAARGDGRGLLLPFSSEFKLAMKSDRPTGQQIVVTGPRNASHVVDAVNRNFPDLYRKGMRDYRLVYDDTYWRVYRRMDAGY